MSAKETIGSILANLEVGEGAVQWRAGFLSLPGLLRADVLKDIKAEIDLRYAQAVGDIMPRKPRTGGRKR